MIDPMKTSIDDLNDDVLVEIFCRLPIYLLTLKCRKVCKRWYRLTSGPLFMRKGNLIHREKYPFKYKDGKTCGSKLVLLLTMRSRDPATYAVIRPYDYFLRSPIVRLPLKVVSTFGDMLLCFNTLKDSRFFKICNLQSKQCIDLPCSPTPQRPVLWAGLVSRGWDLGFRVVLVHSVSYETPGRYEIINFVVYLSETREWKSVDVKFRFQRNSRQQFSAVVCQEMVCIHLLSYSGAFNPFDVTPAFPSGATLSALAIPLPSGGLLLEFCGNLVTMDNILKFSFGDSVGGVDDIIRVNESFAINKLDLKLENEQQQRSLKWERVSRLYGDIRVIGEIVRPTSSAIETNYHYFTVLGTHPDEMHGIYLTLKSGSSDQLFLCNTRSKVLKALYTMPHRMFIEAHKIEYPAWPMPYPSTTLLSKDSGRQSY